MIGLRKTSKRTKRTGITPKRTSQGERGDKIRSKKYYMEVISVWGDGRIVQGNLTFVTSDYAVFCDFAN